MKVTAVLGLIGAIIVATIKESSQGPQLIVLNRNFVISQVVTFGTLLSSLLLMYVIWGIRIAKAFRNNMQWSLRRLRAVQVRFLPAFAGTEAFL